MTESTFCVNSNMFPFTCSLWARVLSTTARRWRRSQYQGSDIFQPDAQAVNSRDGNVTEYGRINIEFLSNGSWVFVHNVLHNIQLEQGYITDNEVFFKIRLSYVDALSLYAVRRFKIESFETDVTTRITPMQPDLQRSKPIIDGFFAGKPKPLDFTCSEFDLPAIPNGAKRACPPTRFTHPYLQGRGR
jgi:hypothetical protein